MAVLGLLNIIIPVKLGLLLAKIDCISFFLFLVMFYPRLILKSEHALPKFLRVFLAQFSQLLGILLMPAALHLLFLPSVIPLGPLPGSVPAQNS